MSKNFTMVISPGHTAKSQGAQRNDISEYGLSCAIVGLVVFDLTKLGHVIHLIGSNSNKKQIERINCLNPDFGIEVHANANRNPYVNGSMCLHSSSDDSKALNFEINKSLVDTLNIGNLGIHFGNYQLDVNRKLIDILRFTKCPFSIIEPLHLSNDIDFSMIDIVKISKGITNGILHYWQNKNAEV